eukprot:jgi/Mesvir1/2838/Mv13928-RA.1
MLEMQATKIRECKTAPVYRMFDVEGKKPAMVRLALNETAGGQSFDVEVWSVPSERFGEFLVNKVRAPLCIGDVELEDGSVLKGFLGEQPRLVGYPDISSHGGWRHFVKSRDAAK